MESAAPSIHRPVSRARYHDLRVARLLDRTWSEYDVVYTWPQAAARTLVVGRRRGVLAAREVPNTHTENAYAEATREAGVVGVSPARGESHYPDPRVLALESREYSSADLLMVPSDPVASTFLDRGVPETRLGRHRYGFDPTLFTSVGRVETPARPFSAVFLGSPTPRKGLHYALEAWRRSGASEGGGRLVIAGRFDPSYRERLAPALEDPSVIERGFVADTPGLLRASDVLLLPSVEEGSALVTYEAQASGCIPLVSTAAGAVLPTAVRELAHHPRDIDGLTHALTLVARDEQFRARLRESVISLSADLTWSDAAEGMIEIFKERIHQRN